MRNPLLDTLEITQTLGVSGDASLAEIAEQFELSLPTARRCIAEARLIGAEIVSIKNSSGWRYHLDNWDQCKTRCLRWIELEKTRSLTWSR